MAEFLFIAKFSAFSNKKFMRYLGTFMDTTLTMIKSEAIIRDFKKHVAQNENRMPQHIKRVCSSSIFFSPNELNNRSS